MPSSVTLIKEEEIRKNQWKMLKFVFSYLDIHGHVFVTYVKMELAVLQTRKSPNIEISQ